MKRANRIVKVRAVGESPIGLYVFTTKSARDRQQMQQIARQLNAILGGRKPPLKGAIVPMLPGESFKALSERAARQLYEHLKARFEPAKVIVTVPTGPAPVDVDELDDGTEAAVGR